MAALRISDERTRLSGSASAGPLFSLFQLRTPLWRTSWNRTHAPSVRGTTTTSPLELRCEVRVMAHPLPWGWCRSHLQALPVNNISPVSRIPPSPMVQIKPTDARLFPILSPLLSPLCSLNTKVLKGKGHQKAATRLLKTSQE